MQVPEVVEVEEGALEQGVVVELHILLFVLWLCCGCVVVVSVLYWDVIREEEKRLLGRSIYRNAVDVVALFTRTRRLFSQLGSSKSNGSDERNARIGERRMKSSQRTGCCKQRLKG